jgi:hypothetical protein
MSMRIDSTFPNHVARAYGLKLVRPEANLADGSPARTSQVTARPSSATPTGDVSLKMPIAPVSPVEVSEKIHQLIAGRVGGPLDFSASRQAISAQGALPMYTRSADQIEAATAIHLGRQLDVKA